MASLETCSSLAELHELEERLRGAQHEYLTGLQRLPQAKTPKEVDALLDKGGVQPLLDRMPPPPDPTLVLFPFPDGLPQPPDPHTLIPEIPMERWHPMQKLRTVWRMCDTNAELEAPTPTYVELHELGKASCSPGAGKSIGGYVTAGQSTQPITPASEFRCGYRTTIPIPDGEAGHVRLESVFNVSLSWLELNTHGTVDLGTGGGGAAQGGGGTAAEQISASLAAEAGGTVVPTVSMTLDARSLSGPNQVIFETGVQLGGILTANVPVPAGPTQVVVEELVTFTCRAADAHVYVSGGCTWSPLKVELSRGCTTGVWELVIPV